MSINIELHNVCKIYNPGNDQVLALDEISFSVQAGEFFTLLGPSGCGKSTIINLIAGFLFPTTGKIFANGEIILKPSPERVIVSQDYGAFPWKTAQENVEFALKTSNIPKRNYKSITHKYLDMVKISKYASKYPFQLSSGMNRRLILARALGIQPECLLMDEPLIGLDMQLRHTMQEDLLNIWKAEEPTIILVTHDLEEALYLSDRVLIMNSQPGSCRKIINIPFDRPREPTLRLTNAFQALKRDVFEYLS